MKKNLTMFLVMLPVCSTVYGGYVHSDYDWMSYNGHQYAITKEYSNWSQAEAWAQEVGGHLATINDSAENSWLSTSFAGYYSLNGYGDHNRSIVWIGLEWINEQWQWSSDEPMSLVPPWYMNSGDRPHGGVHTYLHTDTHHQPGTWWEDTEYDIQSDSYIRGIIEIPEPATLLLLGLGGLVLRRNRK